MNFVCYFESKLYQKLSVNVLTFFFDFSFDVMQKYTFNRNFESNIMIPTCLNSNLSVHIFEIFFYVPFPCYALDIDKFQISLDSFSIKLQSERSIKLQNECYWSTESHQFGRMKLKSKVRWNR